MLWVPSEYPAYGREIGGAVAAIARAWLPPLPNLYTWSPPSPFVTSSTSNIQFACHVYARARTVTGRHGGDRRERDEPPAAAGSS